MKFMPNCQAAKTLPTSVAAGLIIAMFAHHALSAQEIDNVETEGNLAATNPLGCVDATSVENTSTAADVASGAKTCVDSGQYDQAAELIMVANAYAFYDTLRVTDESAHAALTALFADRFSELPEPSLMSLFTSIEALDERSARGREICTYLQNAGPPNYMPTYMIQHGMQPFLNDSTEPPLREIDPDDSWEKALSFINCSD